MQRNRIVIDCDPGIDDTFALLLCIKKLDVAGIVAVGGNTGLQFTSRNARYVTELAGRTDIPVYAGYDQPILGNAVRAEYVHGVGGLGDLAIPEPKKQLEREHGVDFLIRTFMNEDDVGLVTIGPLTNVAQALLKEPELKKRIPEILIMGGAAFCGNQSPVAEFNIAADPEAAKIVMESGIPIRMFGLNATRQNWMGEEQVKELRAVGNKVADVCADLLSFAAKMYGHSELCDASTVSWLIDPAVVKKSLMVHIDVETKGEFTRGMTVCDWRKYMGEDPKEDLSHEKKVDADGKEPNVEMAMEFDKNRFWKLLVETLKEYGK